MKEIVATEYGYQMVQYGEKNMFISAKEIAKRESEKENKNDQDITNRNYTDYSA